MTFPQVPISEVCEKIVVGHVGPSSSHRCEGGLPFLMGKNVGEGFLKLDSLERVSPEFHHAQKKSQLSPGDVVVVRIGQSGLAAQVPPELGEANCAGLVVIKGPRAVTADYLVRYLNSAAGRRQSLKQTKGSTRQTLNTKSVAETTIPLPPLPEQKRIAKILDAADALRAKRRESLAQLDTFLQSTFLDMFGDPVTNPKRWPKARLGESASKITDGEHLNPKFSETGMPMVMAGNVLEAGVDLESAKRIEPELGAKFRKKCAPEENDILLVSRGATIGRACIIRTPLEFCLMGSVILVKPLTEKLRSSYLSWFLRQPAIKATLYKTSGSSAQQAIYIKDIRKLVCMVPPLDLQDRFTTIVESVEHQKTRFRAHLAELDTLFASLQHRAFNGEL